MGEEFFDEESKKTMKRLLGMLSKEDLRTIMKRSTLTKEDLDDETMKNILARENVMNFVEGLLEKLPKEELEKMKRPPKLLNQELKKFESSNGEEIKKMMRKIEREKRKLEITIRLPKDECGKRRIVYKGEFLGEGNYGSVHKVKDKEGTAFALKIVKFSIAEDIESLAKLEEKYLLKIFEVDKECRATYKSYRKELKASEKIDDKHICRILCFGFVEWKIGTISKVKLCLLSEFVEGINLKKFIEDNKSLEDEKKVDILRQLARGLKIIHDAGVVHRDLYPKNIMVTNNGIIVIIDFGIAFFLDVTLSTLSRTLMGERDREHYKNQGRGRGNPPYMHQNYGSPENMQVNMV